MTKEEMHRKRVTGGIFLISAKTCAILTTNTALILRFGSALNSGLKENGGNLRGRSLGVMVECESSGESRRWRDQRSS